MEEPIVIAAVAAAVLVVVVVVLLVRRRPARDAGPLGPARLGPSWSPAEDDEPQVPTIDPTARAEDIDALARRTGIAPETVRTVATAWDEYRAVLGLARLPADHRYRVYDPYVPPVAERGPDGPILDRTRVARDVALRTVVSQSDATTILAADAALSGDPDPSIDHEEAAGEDGASEVDAPSEQDASTER